MDYYRLSGDDSTDSDSDFGLREADASARVVYSEYHPRSRLNGVMKFFDSVGIRVSKKLVALGELIRGEKVKTLNDKDSCEEELVSLVEAASSIELSDEISSEVEKLCAEYGITQTSSSGPGATTTRKPNVGKSDSEPMFGISDTDSEGDCAFSDSESSADFGENGTINGRSGSPRGRLTTLTRLLYRWDEPTIDIFVESIFEDSNPQIKFVETCFDAGYRELLDNVDVVWPSDDSDAGSSMSDLPTPSQIVDSSWGDSHDKNRSHRPTLNPRREDTFVTGYGRLVDHSTWFKEDAAILWEYNDRPKSYYNPETVFVDRYKYPRRYKSWTDGGVEYYSRVDPLTGNSTHVVDLGEGVPGFNAVRHVEVLSELYYYLKTHMSMKPRTVGTLISVREKARVWCKENNLDNKVVTRYMAVTIAASFALTVHEKTALSVMTSAQTRLAIHHTAQLGSGSLRSGMTMIERITSWVNGWLFQNNSHVLLE